MHLVLLFGHLDSLLRHLGSLFRHLGSLFRQLVYTAAASQGCVQASREGCNIHKLPRASKPGYTSVSSQCYARILFTQVHFVPDASTYGSCLLCL